MKNLKKIAFLLPQCILIPAVMFYWISAGLLINPIAIGLIAGLVLQMMYKNRIIGFIIPALLMLTSFYMLLALVSDFKEYNIFNSASKTLFFVGLSYFVSTIVVSVKMIYKYATSERSKPDMIE